MFFLAGFLGFLEKWYCKNFIWQSIGISVCEKCVLKMLRRSDVYFKTETLDPTFGEMKYPWQKVISSLNQRHLWKYVCFHLFYCRVLKKTLFNFQRKPSFTFVFLWKYWLLVNKSILLWFIHKNIEFCRNVNHSMKRIYKHINKELSCWLKMLTLWPTPQTLTVNECDKLFALIGGFTQNLSECKKKFGKNIAFKNLEFIGTVINIFLWKADIIVFLVLINSKKLSKENSFNEFLYYIKLFENRNIYVQASAIR